ncbi:MAG: cation diffusion facilitator family transporter [Thermoprotei archaeon]
MHDDNLMYKYEDDHKLLFVLSIAMALFVFEVVGGIISNSLALISDAGHVLTDIFALALSFLAIRISYKLPTNKMTYGFHRIRILVAFINGLLLFLISLYIFYEAYMRLFNPPKVLSILLLVFAIIGFLVNLYMTLILKQTTDLNVKSAYYHVVTDTLQSVAVIAGGMIIIITKMYIIDTIISIIIGIFILRGGLRIVKNAINILLEGVPANIRLEDVKETLMKVDGVKDVHDIHIWCITPEIMMLTCHVAITSNDLNHASEILSRINLLLKERYNINHSTIQIEPWKERI